MFLNQRDRSLIVNLPGQCWAEIQQLALIGSSSSLHSEACNALGASDGVIHSRISLEVVSLRASTNKHFTIFSLQASESQCKALEEPVNAQHAKSEIGCIKE